MPSSFSPYSTARTHYCPDVKLNPTPFAEWATRWCEEKSRQHNAKSIYLPAGNTPIPLYQHWIRSQPAFLESLQPVQIDEVITGAKRGIFKQFFVDELPFLAPKLAWIEEAAPQQCDLAILGIGLNGHIAFHEPGLDPELWRSEVTLSAKTRDTLGLESGARGLTYGAGAFKKCRAILVLIAGEGKRSVLQELAAMRSASPEFPMSLLLGHPDLTFLVDTGARY